MTPENLESILVIQMTKMGDFLQTTPLLAALKERHPSAELGVLVPPLLVDVAKACPAVDTIRTLDLNHLHHVALNPKLTLAQKLAATHRRLEDLTTETWDLVLNINYSEITSLIAEIIPAKQRRGYHFGRQRQHMLREEWTNFIFQHMTDRRLIRFNLVDILTNYVQAESNRAHKPAFEFSDQDRAWAEDRLAEYSGPKKLWGLQVGAKNELRRWPVERFAELAATVINDFRVNLMLTGTADERPLIEQFLGLLKEKGINTRGRILDLAGETSLGQLAACLARIERLVTGDTGTMHLATAVGTPVLALFMGPAHCHETGPYGEGHVVIQAKSDCFPCQEAEPACGDFDCRTIITSKIALETIEERFDPEIYPPEVDVYQSRLDDFGVIYRPLLRRPVETETALALALREVGRRYLDSGYRVDLAVTGDQWRQDYLPPDGADRVRIDQLAANLGLIRNMARQNTATPQQLSQQMVLAARAAHFSTLLHPLVRTLAGRLSRKPDADSVRAVHRALKDAAGGMDLWLEGGKGAWA